jgi:hypothetical protein
MKGFGIAGLAALGACLGVGLLASPARAQTPPVPICGDLFDECQIANDVFAWNADEFEEFFPLDEKTCADMASGVLAQCEAGVKAGVKCWSAQFNSIPKNARPACKSERSPASDCNIEFKYDAKTNVNYTKAIGEFEIGCCEERANDFFELCVLGDPE